jgi:hypothetical protein
LVSGDERREQILRQAFGDQPWYAVRCVFQSPDSAAPDSYAYEERITLWRATSFEEAVEKATGEALQYLEDDTAEEFTGLVQAYHLFKDPADGSEVFSLIRHSPLESEDYIRQFFATGAEATRQIE